MTEVAPGVWQLAGFPPHLINVYLAGDVLIDAGTRWARRRIWRQLRGRAVRLLALTHCHPDHQGAAAWLCSQLGIPLACHEADVPYMEGREPMLPRNSFCRLAGPCMAGPPRAVDHVLRDGDTVGDFRVVHAPGHTPGHVVYFRESDRLAIAGDVLNNLGPLRLGWLLPGLREPPALFSADPEENRQSVRKLIDLRPSTVCFGHGPPLRDGRLLERFGGKG